MRSGALCHGHLRQSPTSLPPRPASGEKGNSRTVLRLEYAPKLVIKQKAAKPFDLAAFCFQSRTDQNSVQSGSPAEEEDFAPNALARLWPRARAGEAAGREAGDAGFGAAATGWRSMATRETGGRDAAGGGDALREGAAMLDALAATRPSPNWNWVSISFSD